MFSLRWLESLQIAPLDLNINTTFYLCLYLFLGFFLFCWNYFFNLLFMPIKSSDPNMFLNLKYFNVEVSKKIFFTFQVTSFMCWLVKYMNTIFNLILLFFKSIPIEFPLYNFYLLVGNKF